MVRGYHGNTQFNKIVEGGVENVPLGRREIFSEFFLRFCSPSRVAITLQLKLSLVLPRTDFLCITQFPASLRGSVIDIFIKFYKLFFNSCCKKFFELVLKIRYKKCRLFDLNMKFKLWSETK